MKTSLQTRVSILITLIILSISIIATCLFNSSAHRSKERELSGRGSALSYALSKAAEEGIVTGDPVLIMKAASIIQGPDVSLAQVYSNRWDALDAYPPGSLKDRPHSEALKLYRALPGRDTRRL
jgi:hypothetical protein